MKNQNILNRLNPNIKKRTNKMKKISKMIKKMRSQITSKSKKK